MPDPVVTSVRTSSPLPVNWVTNGVVAGNAVRITDVDSGTGIVTVVAGICGVGVVDGDAGGELQPATRIRHINPAERIPYRMIIPFRIADNNLC